MMKGSLILHCLSNAQGIHFLYNHGHSEKVFFKGELESGIELENQLVDAFLSSLSILSGEYGNE